MSDNHPQQQKEYLEKPGSQVETGLEALKRAAKEVVDKDKNAEFTATLANMDILNPQPKDKESVEFMLSELMNIITKIAKKYPDKSLSNITPQNLSQIAKESGIELNRSSETMSLQKLDLLNMHPNNPLTLQLYASWAAMLQKVEDIRTFPKKQLNWIRKNPGTTALLCIGGVLGIYFGPKIIKWGWRKLKETTKEQIKSFFSPGRLVILGSIAAGSYWGKDIIKKIAEAFAAKKGVRLTKEEMDRIKEQLTKVLGNLEKLAEQFSKATTPEEKARYEALLIEEKKKLEAMMAGKNVPAGAVQELSEKAKEAVEEARWHTARPESIPQQERERATRLSEFIKRLNTHFEISPQMIASIGNMKYEEARITGGGKMAKAAHLFQLMITGEITLEKTKKIVYTRSPEQFINFLKEVLNNKGDINDFKNKTVYEVLEMIEKDQNKYINSKELKRLQLEKKKKDRRDEMTRQLLADSTLWNKPEFQHEYAALHAESGGTAVLTLSKKATIWIFENGIPVFRHEFKFLHGTLNKLAENLKENDDPSIKFMGYYLATGGALTASCGATLGTGIGIAKAFTSGRPTVTYGVWKIGYETIRYGYRGLMLPLNLLLDAVKGAYYWADMGINPVKMAQRFIDQELAIFEQLKLEPFIQRRGWTSTYIEKIFEGKIKVKSPRQLDRVVWKLQNRLEDL